MEAAYTLEDARVIFPDLVEEARATGRPVVLTDDGEPVAAIVSIELLEAYQSAASHPDSASA